MQNPSVIFEDDYILALNKPAGWVVNDSETAHGNPTLQSYIESNYNFETSHKKELRSGIVHRLDKPTSGIILIAKSDDLFYELQKQFAERQIEKTYVALVHGKVEPSEGIINEPVGRLPWKRTNFGVLPEGREAITNYKALKYIKDYTFVELHPKTGRTHQLRVHMKHMGNPIVGDHLYAGRKIAKSDLKEFGRLMLHAKSIEFTHPITKKIMKLEAPLPEGLQSLLH
jgi:23S rRNA pseudouridine1911/1915/1917 synthase